MKILDPKFRKNMYRYIFQTLLAASSVFVILLFLNIKDDTAIIASLGATTFIMFAKPRSYPSRARHLFGGYFLGIFSGVLFNWVSRIPWIEEYLSHHISTIAFCALAVGFAMLLMTTLDAEHAPAAGIALGLVLNTWSWKTVLVVISAVIMLYAIKKIFGPLMINIE